MSLSEFTLRIFLIFLPGVISFIIVEQLIDLKKIQAYRFFINSLILGSLCYLLYYPISLVPFFNLDFYFLKSLANNKLTLDFREILITSLIAVLMGFIVSRLINRKILDKIGDRFKATKKFSDNIDDIWSFIMNSEVPEWVVVRDIENDLMYEGWIRAFSTVTEKDELYLRDVKVFTNSTAQLLYEIPGIYLSRNRESFTIEFPSMEFSENKKRKDNNQVEGKNE